MGFYTLNRSDIYFFTFFVKKRIKGRVSAHLTGAGGNGGIEMITLITLGQNFVASTTAYIGELFTDVSMLLVLVIGLPLAFWAIRRIVGLVRLRG